MVPQFQPLATHHTDWDPSNVLPALNITLDACFVPSASYGSRLDVAHLVVLDNFIDEDIRRCLLDAITAPGWDHQQGPPQGTWENCTADTPDYPRTWGLKHEALVALEASTLPAKLEVQSRLAALYPEVTIMHQPSDAIQAPSGPHPAHHAVCSTGVGSPPNPDGCSTEHGGTEAQQQQQQQQLLQQQQQQAKGAGSEAQQQQQQQQEQQQEQQQQAAGAEAEAQQQQVLQQQGQAHAHHSSTATYTSPTNDLIQQSQQLGQCGPVAQVPQAGLQHHHASPSIHSDGDEAQGAGSPSTQQGQAASYDCHAMLANAAMHGDEYGWHQDADPQTFPDTSPFTQQYGHYTNREPGKPLFVSLLLYLNDHWPRDWGAETLFLDVPSDTGILVRPKPYRAVLMDQDITHRLSAPARKAEGRPRYSLVWKLVFMPKAEGQQCSTARPEWGAPDPFGSAAKAQALVAQLARKRPRTGS